MRQNRWSVFGWILGIFFCAGCAETAMGYRLPDHQISTVHRAAILPFLDTRTFRDPNDQENLSLKIRDTFAAAFKEHPSFQHVEVVMPEVTTPIASLTLDQILAIGRQAQADIVITGQVFSYTETRAASIPPRAGLFVSIFSVSEGRLVFVGDDYRAAAVPGARGGRDVQGKLSAQAIVASYAADPASRPTAPTPVPKDAPKVLLLPYHDRQNSANFIENTGGGQVVTYLFRMEMEKAGAFHVLCPPPEEAGHQKLLSKEEAIALAKRLGADYVIRGQVIEFRRAKSVPSWYSVVLSWTILAAQMLFAEISGVDIATEVYRVSDQSCILARRDSSYQKYVVQAEKTVRALAPYTIQAMRTAIQRASQGERIAVTPIIDTLPSETPAFAATEKTVSQVSPVASSKPSEKPSEAKKEPEKKETKVVPSTVSPSPREKGSSPEPQQEPPTIINSGTPPKPSESP